MRGVYTGGMPIPLPLAMREIYEELDERLAQVPTELNEYGYDPFGLDPSFLRQLGPLAVMLYRHYFRVETRGIENVPEGRVLLIANHGGNTIPMDAVTLFTAMLLEAEPPRIARGMAEFYLPRIPWWSGMIHRGGAVVGTPENCARLLEAGEAIMIFPEGSRGFIKPYRKAYKLQRFGTGFARLALANDTPVVPIGIIGSEEQSPGLVDSKLLGRLIGAPAFPITLTFPFLGPLGFLPMPVKYRLFFGEPIKLEGDADDDDAQIRQQVRRVTDQIGFLLEEGLKERKHWFA